jgi:glutaredoxin 3
VSKKRKIEVFSAGCAVCEETVALIKKIACSSCNVQILDMHDKKVVGKAKRYGIRSIPAVVINGKLADCCIGRGVQEASLRAAGMGVSLA